jgi:hypothetical protein
MQRFIQIVSDFLQIILVARLLTSGHIIINKSPPKMHLGVDGAFPQAEKPLVHRMVDDHRQIVGHHIFITMCCSDAISKSIIHCSGLAFPSYVSRSWSLRFLSQMIARNRSVNGQRLGIWPARGA